MPGIGTAIQLPNGGIHVKYPDGTQLWADGKHKVRYQHSDGSLVSFSENDNIPRVVMEKLQQIPKILKHLLPNPHSSKPRLIR